MDEYRAANRENWDDRVAIHVRPDGYDAAGFAADPERITNVVQWDATVLGDVRGKRLLHLQCHFGMDTLSWARLGARVTGVDFSGKAIEAARALSDGAGLPSHFVVAELYESPTVLVGEAFDIVYTGVGAINWLPDIAGWAKVVAHFVAPGGTFYIRDAHPALQALDWEAIDSLVLGLPYFETDEPFAWDEETTYSGEGTVEHTRTYEWNHGLGEIFTALTDAGLRVTMMAEHRELEWQGHPMMVQGADRRWRFPGVFADRIPAMVTMMVVRDRAS